MGKMVKADPDVVRIEQKTTSTCWLAACQMLYQWKGKPIDEVETKLKLGQRNG